jgi:hypothetical protein
VISAALLLGFISFVSFVIFSYYLLHKKRTHLITLFLIVLSYKYLFYSVIPFLYDISTDFYQIELSSINLKNYGKLMIIDFISWTSVFLISFLLVRSPITYSKKNHLIIYLFVLLGLFFRIVTMGYSVDIGDAMPGFVYPFRTLLDIFSYVGPPLFAGYFLANRSFSLAIFWILLALIPMIDLETRGSVFNIILLFCFSWISAENKHILRRVFFLFSSIFAFTFILSSAPILSVDGYHDSKSKMGEQSLFREFIYRFSISNHRSSNFFPIVEREGFIYFDAITSSLMGFLPRSVFENKPHPSAPIGDDGYSAGMYRIMAESEGPDSISMVELNSAAHGYWEFGYFGAILFPLISVVYLLLASKFFHFLGPIVPSIFYISSIKPIGFFDPRIWLADIVMQVYQVLIPMLVLALLVYIIRKFSLSKRGLL